jgi:hypothetical protein
MRDPLEEKNSDGRFYVGLFLLVAIIVGGVIWMVAHQRGGFGPPPPPNQEDIEHDRLAAPGLTDQQVLQYVSSIVVETMTLDGRTFPGHLVRFERYFTPDGWSLLNRTLDRYQILDLLRTSNIEVVPVLTGEPAMLARGVEDAIFQWRVSIPLTLNLKSPDKTLERKMFAHARISRKPREQFPEGVAIDSVNFLPDETSGATVQQ